MSYCVTLIAGDGIGGEIVPAARRVVDATGVAIEWEECLAGEAAFEKFGDAVPDETIASIKKNKVAIKGPLTNLVGRGWASPNVTLRSKLGLFAQIRRMRSFEGVPTPFKNVDVLVVREATEDAYAGAEQWVGPDASVCIKFVTRATSENVARFTMNYARQLGRKRITVAHKANIQKLTDGLFLQSALTVGKEFPDLTVDSQMIDHIAYQLVKTPQDYDIILASNVYGDILSDLAAGIVGSLGLGFGGNYGPDTALFEAVHGTAPRKAGKGISNPVAMILSAGLMLSYLGEPEAARAIERAVEVVLREGKDVTADLGGQASTGRMTDAIIDKLG